MRNTEGWGLRLHDRAVLGCGPGLADGALLGTEEGWGLGVLDGALLG